MALNTKLSSTQTLQTTVVHLSPGTSCWVVDKAIVITQTVLQVSVG